MTPQITEVNCSSGTRKRLAPLVESWEKFTMFQSEHELHPPRANVLETSNFIHVACREQAITEMNDVLSASNE